MENTLQPSNGPGEITGIAGPILGISILLCGLLICLFGRGV